jgi:transposase
VETMIACCCGIDVHKAQLTACVRMLREGKLIELIETFGTTTPDLLALRDWLTAHGVTHVAMESTGVYWKSPYYMLEGEFEVLLVNAAHIKHVPGRKTDTIDAQWIAQLLACGLLRGSFVPPKPIRRLRDLTRYRKALIEERSRAVNRLHKLLEDAGIKLACVATDIMGVSGRAMMRALIGGTEDSEALSALAKGKLRNKLPALRKALTGRFEDHHAFLLERMLAHIEELEADIEALTARIEEEIRPFEPAVELLRSIPGVERRAAEVIIAEIGTDMSVFPTAAHLASWAGMCPGNNASAGKRNSGRTRKANVWLKATLTECSWAAARSRGTYLSAQFWRFARRLGRKRAATAVGHSILVIAWHLLSRDCDYIDLGSDYFATSDADHTRRRALSQLQALGYQVTLEPAA